MKGKIKFLLVIFILVVTVLGACNIKSEPTSENDSGNLPEFVRPNTEQGAPVFVNMTDASLYEEYQSQELPEVIERVSSSIVQVVSENNGSYTYSSGVVIGNTEDGRFSYVVTCFHSVKSANSVSVNIVKNGEIKILGATPVGADPQTNLCVIRIEESITPAVFLSESANLVKAGESIIVVANTLNTTMAVSSNGIVSATSFIVDAGEGKTNSYMLTDALVNSNSAGGGAFTEKGGFLAGIIDNTASGKNNWSGCILPSSVVASVCTDIIENGFVPGRYKLGVTVADNRTSWGVTESIVVTALSTDGSLYSEGSGLRVGDVITGISYQMTDVYLSDSDNFYEFLYYECEFSLGDQITFFIIRNNTKDSITVTIKQYDYFAHISN